VCGTLLPQLQVDLRDFLFPLVDKHLFRPLGTGRCVVSSRWTVVSSLKATPSFCPSRGGDRARSMTCGLFSLQRNWDLLRESSNRGPIFGPVFGFMVPKKDGTWRLVIVSDL